MSGCHVLEQGLSFEFSGFDYKLFKSFTKNRSMSNIFACKLQLHVGILLKMEQVVIAI